MTSKRRLAVDRRLRVRASSGPTYVYPWGVFPGGRCPVSVRSAIFCPGIALASWVRVSDQLAYDAPTVMWRMRRADDLSSHAVIGCHADGAIVTWFLNDRPLGSRVFSDWTGALRWCDQLQAQNWTVGWRLVLEYDDLLDSE